MSFGNYRNQKRNEYKLLLSMHSNPLPSLVTPEELAQAEVIERELKKENGTQKQAKFSTRQAQYQDILRYNAQLTNEKNALEQELAAFKVTIQAYQRYIMELRYRQQTLYTSFKEENIESDGQQLKTLRGQLQNRLEMLSTNYIEQQRMLETHIRYDFRAQLKELENDCQYLQQQRDYLINDPAKVQEVLEEKQYLKKRAEELYQENFRLRQDNSTLYHRVSEYKALTDDITTKQAQVQRKLADYESKIKLYEEMLEIQLMPDVPIDGDEHPERNDADNQVYAITRTKYLEMENYRLQRALTAAHKLTIQAQKSRMKLLQTPYPIKQLLIDILQQINAEITENTIERDRKRSNLNESIGMLSLQNSTASYVQMREADDKFAAEELDELRQSQRGKILMHLLENKRIIEMTISALDVEQSLLLSGNADILSWIKTGIVY